ncbi:hypothetical protein ACA910_006439 [Epithemia clementina (nom. ined.)]
MKIIALLTLVSTILFSRHVADGANTYCDLISVVNPLNLNCPIALKGDIEGLLATVSSCVLDKERNRVRNLRGFDQDVRGLGSSCCCCCSCSRFNQYWYCSGPCAGKRRELEEHQEGYENVEYDNIAANDYQDQHDEDEHNANDRVTASGTSGTEREDLVISLKAFNWATYGFYPIINIGCIPDLLTGALKKCLSTAITLATDDCTPP